MDDRRIISEIIFVIRDGLRSRDAPKAYGPQNDLQPFHPLEPLGYIQRDLFPMDLHRRNRHLLALINESRAQLGHPNLGCVNLPSHLRFAGELDYTLIVPTLPSPLGNRCGKSRYLLRSHELVENIRPAIRSLRRFPHIPALQPSTIKAESPNEFPS